MTCENNKYNLARLKKVKQMLKQSDYFNLVFISVEPIKSGLKPGWMDEPNPNLVTTSKKFNIGSTKYIKLYWNSKNWQEFM